MNTLVEEVGPSAEPRAHLEVCRPDRTSNAATVRQDLRAILGEGAAVSIMVGVGESYLAAYVLAMGLGQVAAGLITTVPLLIGAFLQLISPWAVRRLGSHRRWIVWCALVQAGSFLPLAVGALYGSLNVFFVFAAAAIYWGSGLATSAAWSTWVDALVPGRVRARYFSRRTRWGQFATLGGFVVGGVSLQVGDWADRRLLAFALLFLSAAVCRSISAALLASQSEVKPLARAERHVSLGEFWQRIRTSGEGRLLVYLLSVQAAAQIAGPYFTPYMLGPRQMSYAAYVSLIAIAFAAKAISLPAFGSLAEKLGARHLLWIGGLGIVPISGLWVFSGAYPFLVLVQILAGVTWAAYELAMLLLFFESIRAEERMSMLTTFNLANSVATVAGSLLGGALLAYGGKSEEAYLWLFGLSSMARALTLVRLIRVPSFSRAVSHTKNKHDKPSAIVELHPPVSAPLGQHRWSGGHERPRELERKSA